MLRKIFLVILISLLSIVSLSALSYESPGKPTGLVNDFANVLDPATKASLERKLYQFKQETSNEIAVVIIPSLNGDTIENYSEKLFQEWGIGKKDKDNGVLILVSIGDRKTRIEVGYGLEGALPDAQSFWIIQKLIIPNFKNNNYAAGIDAAADKIMAVTKGEYVSSTNNETTSANSITQVSSSKIKKGEKINLSFSTILGIIAIFIVRKILMKKFAAGKKLRWVNGATGFSVALIIGLLNKVSLHSFFITCLFCTAIGLFLDNRDKFRSVRYGRSRRFGRGGRFGGDRFGGGGDGGGFGGGRSGGSGSSGGW